MMELQIRTARVSIPQEIENMALLKTEIGESLAKYKKMVVTADGISDAKKTLADLRKLKNAIDGRRKDVKKQCLELCEPLVKQCDTLTHMIDEPIEAIKSQINAFEEEEIKSKWNDLQSYFDSVNVMPFVKIEKIVNPKWKNRTIPLESLKAEIKAYVQRIINEHGEIMELYGKSENLTAIMHKFETTLSKSETLVYAATLEHDTRYNAISGVDAVKGQTIPETNETAHSVESGANYGYVSDNPTITGTFRVTGTTGQIIALRDFLKANNIKFEILEG